MNASSSDGQGRMPQASGTPYHHGSHRGLLQDLPRTLPPQTRVDAIIVPTKRPLRFLAEVAHLARELDCPLVTLHSGEDTNARDAGQRLTGDVDLIAIDVREPARLRFPDLETSRILADNAIFERQTDLSTKRNLGLILSHMLGWSSIAFFDDDITDFRPDDVRQAAGLLGRYHAVGLQVSGYPDHSVVCHAYLEAGGDQKSFIGGGALTVRVDREKSFFPDIYNDDWFFMLDAKDGLQPVATIGKVSQAPFDPYRTPDRARAEELGDVLAEGVYWLLDQDGSMADADERHWKWFLSRRRRFIKQVLAMVERDSSTAASSIQPAGAKLRKIAALKGSLGRLGRITPELCRDYLLAWAADRERWQRHIEQLPATRSREEALGWLSRPGEPKLTWHVRKDRDVGRKDRDAGS